MTRVTSLPKVDVDQSLQQAVAHHKAGRLQVAEGLYRTILHTQPQNPDASHNLGAILMGAGQVEQGLKLLKVALELDMRQGQYWLSYIEALLKVGKVTEAKAALEQGKQFGVSGPLFAEIVLRLDERIKGLALNATLFAEAERYLKAGQLVQAERLCHQILSLDAGHAASLHLLGLVAYKTGRSARAVEMFNRAIALDAAVAQYHFNLGDAHMAQGLVTEAISDFQCALAIDSNYAEALVNLAYAHKVQGRHIEAITCCEAALSIEPDYFLAICLLAEIHQEQGNVTDAIANLQQVLKVEPHNFDAYSSLLLLQNLSPNRAQAESFTEAQFFGELVAQNASPNTVFRNTTDPSRCLRVGLVSGDLHAHPVGYFVEGPLKALSGLATKGIEIFAYSNSATSDAVTERIKVSCQGWFWAAGVPDQALAQRIRDDEIDILIDLSGHTAHNRLPLFAWKPAPVQVTWLGYLATTGVAAIDYVLADAWTLPESEEINFTEKVWRLPESYLCLTPPDSDVDVGPLPALLNGHVTFGSYNNLSKVNNDVVALWARVLHAVAGSRLYIKSPQLKDVSVQQSTKKRFAAHGIEEGRLILEGFVPRADYLKAYQRVDIALDPFPYPGITTTVETLWMGVPVLTLAGRSFLSRQGIGLMMNAGLPEWVATDADDYVVRAVSHASDLHTLSALRSKLRHQVLTSPIFDAQRFGQHFEDALRSMWVRWCSVKSSPNAI